MATDGEHVAAAVEETPGRKVTEGEPGAMAELPAPSGWTKKLNPIRGGKFEVIFVSPTGQEIKSKRQLTQYLKAHPGGHVSSAFDWGTGNTPRRSARISEKVKAIESPEDEKPPKRERSSNSKRGKKEKQDDALDEAGTGDHGNAEEAKGTDVEMKDADAAQEEKKDADAAQEEKKDADAAKEEKKEALGTEATEKTEEGAGKAEGSEVRNNVSAPVSENKADGKAAESAVPPPASSEGETALPPSETKADASAAEAANDAGNSTDNTAQKDEQVNTAPEEPSLVNCDKGQIQLGASAVKCT